MCRPSYLDARDACSAAGALALKINEVLESANHQWFLNKMNPAEHARRKKAMQEFRTRYDK